jgi:carbonic anhydrase
MSGSINAAEIKNPADLEMTAIRQNVKINVKKLSESTPILRRRVKRGELKVVGGIYHLTTGLVEIV